MRVVVVGGGVMGLAAARGLVLHGHEPVVLDQGPVPNPKSSSVDQHRLIRYSYGPQHGYARMIRDAYGAWERLWADLGERHYVGSGQVLVGPLDDPWNAGARRSLELLDVPFEVVEDEAAIAARFPMLDPARVPRLLHTPTGGVLLADRIVAGLAAWLRRRGVEIRESARVADLDPARAAARLGDGSEVAGDALLVTVGAWLPRLVPGLAEVARPTRQVVVYVERPDGLATWDAAPMVTDVAGDDVFYAIPPVAGTGLKFGDHRFSLGGDPDGDRDPSPDEVREVMALAGRRLRDAPGYAVRGARVCFYTVTPDERFLARREGPATLVLSPCSGHGFKFSAVIGERVARLLDGGEALEDFLPWLEGRLGEG